MRLARAENQRAVTALHNLAPNGGANGRGLAHAERNPISPDLADGVDFGRAEERF
jgi:hypothetical protein